MSKRIMLLRSAPYDIDSNGYNIQEIGLGRAFVRLGYDFDFVNDKKSNISTTVFYEENNHCARIIEYPRLRFMRWGINRKVVSNQFLSNYDYIISREYYQLMTYLASKNSPNVSMYSGPYYNMFMIPFFSPIYDLALTKKMNRNIKYKFVKSALAKSYLEKKGYTNVIDVGVGLDIEKFNNVNIDERTTELVQFMRKNECILYIGAVSDRKNYPFLLDVFSECLKIKPNLKLVIIGKSKVSAFSKLFGVKDNKYKERIDSHYSEDVLENVVHIEKINNAQLQYIYPEAKAFLLPSKQEIFGMVLLEAMYFGAPVISSLNGGATSLISDEKYGIVLEDFDAKKWALHINKLLDDTEHRNYIIQNAHNRILSDFTWDAIAKKMLGYLENGEDTPNE